MIFPARAGLNLTVLVRKYNFKNIPRTGGVEPVI